tara:strand:- start:428 stop:901 length:474 start_codon:yes stop_codon:yes gene_type:complete
MLIQDTKVKLYLEGLRIPFVNITINENAMSTFPTASITLPALKEGLKLLPRTQVHVFYKLPSGIRDARKDKFYLVFEGEIATISYDQSSFSRYLNIGCAGIFNYFAHTLKGMGADPGEVNFSNDTLLHFNFTNREDMAPETTSGGDDKIQKKITERD